MNFKPMLAGKAPEDLSTLRFPLLASPKLDGIRCIIQGGRALSRKLLPIPNRYVQAQLAGLPDGLDGELMLDLPGSFAKVSSAVMSVEGESSFTFCVFDWYGAAGGHEERLRQLVEILAAYRRPHVDYVPHYPIPNLHELRALEARFLVQGFEGVMLRSLDGPYKQGRSTAREGYLLKLKRFEDAEAVVIDCQELMHNENEAAVNALGHTKRSTAKAGKVAGGRLGALVCRRADGVEFNIGAGFTEDERVSLWSLFLDGQIVGETVKFKFQPDPSAPGAAPRFPVMLGFRSEIDQ